MKKIRVEPGNLVEVRSGKRAGLLARVTTVAGEKVAGVRLEIASDLDEPVTITECEELLELERGNLIVLPWPDEVKAQTELLKAAQLEKVRLNDRHVKPEPSIRVFSPEVFGLVGGWDT